MKKLKSFLKIAGQWNILCQRCNFPGFLGSEFSHSPQKIAMRVGREDTALRTPLELFLAAEKALSLTLLISKPGGINEKT
jgi:hypothetical protein